MEEEDKIIMKKGIIRTDCYGEFSRNNPARRRDAIRRVKKQYEQSDRGKRVRQNNYIAKYDFLLNCKAQIGCQGKYYDEDAHMEINCLENDPVILDFHHRNPEEKKFTIGAASACRSWGAIILEIEKCDVLCRNCHSRTHSGLWQQLKGIPIIHRPEKNLNENQLELRI